MFSYGLPMPPPTPFLPPSSFLPFLLLRLGPRAAGDCVLRALEREPEAEGELLLLRTGSVWLAQAKYDEPHR